MEHIKELDEAIFLHQIHMDDPKTATAKSQTKLMNLLKAAQKKVKQREGEKEGKEESLEENMEGKEF